MGRRLGPPSFLGLRQLRGRRARPAQTPAWEVTHDSEAGCTVVPYIRQLAETAEGVGEGGQYSVLRGIQDTVMTDAYKSGNTAPLA